MGLVRLGKVARAIGLKGFLGVAGSSGGLAEVGELVLRKGGAERALKVVEARPQGKLWAVKVEGVDDRTAAEGWVGSEVWAERGELGEAEEGEFLWADLEGLEVVTAQGEAVGKVTELYATGGVDVLVVRGEKGEALIPLAPYVTVDLEQRRIVVDPPAGLLEAASEGGETE